MSSIQKQEFTCVLLETRDKSIKIEHNGSTVFIPRSQIEKMSTGDDDRIALTIPAWLYDDKFDG